MHGVFQGEDCSTYSLNSTIFIKIQFSHTINLLTSKHFFQKSLPRSKILILKWGGGVKAATTGMRDLSSQYISYVLIHLLQSYEPSIRTGLFWKGCTMIFLFVYSDNSIKCKGDPKPYPIYSCIVNTTVRERQDIVEISAISFIVKKNTPVFYLFKGIAQETHQSHA